MRASTSNTQSCTSKPCKWNIPRKRTGSVVPIVNMKFSKHDYSKKYKKERESSVPAGHDVRALHQRQWSDHRVANMLMLVREYQESSGNIVGWSYILPQETSISNPTTGGEEVENTLQDSDNLISPIKEQPISLLELKDRCERIKKKLQFDCDEISKAEEKTRGQSNNKLWYSLRKYRITASKCHRIAAQRELTSPTKAVEEILMYKSPYQSASMKEGIDMEDKILEEYRVLMEEKGHCGINVSKCGLFISKVHGFLGASPDGLVFDPSSSDSAGLVEVKCIQVLNEESLADAMLRKRICTNKNVVFELNPTHQYYYQVQQQMFVTERNWTDFVVKTRQRDGIFCQRVYFSVVFWEKTLPKLKSFFERWIVPEIAYSRIKEGLPKLDLRASI